jgi:hypothetical protein
MVGYYAVARVFKGYSPLQAVTFPLAPSPAKLCEIGAPVTAALERYRDKYGHFPSSLVEAGLSPRDTFYGPWEYKILEDGQSCELANGDYGRYLFVVSWSPKNGWYIDT